MNLVKVVASIVIIVLITVLVYISKDSIRYEGDVLPQNSETQGLTKEKVIAFEEAKNPEEKVLHHSESIPSLWQSIATVKEPPSLRNDIDDAELVSYQRTIISQLSSGSIVEVFIPQLDQSMKILITRSDLLASGNVSLRGHLAENPLFSFVMTIGEKTMFATIGTANGIFNVSGNQDSAWVIPAASLKKHMNTDILDYRSKPENNNPPPSGKG